MVNWSETIQLLDNALQLDAEVLDLHYLLNIDYGDTTTLNALYSTYNEIEKSDSTITTASFFLALLELKMDRKINTIYDFAFCYYLHNHN